MTRALGITVDWDYFVEYNNDWDINSNESLMCLIAIWKHRKHLVNDVQNSGEEKSFWHILHKHLNINDLCVTVSDSHACIVDDVNIWRDCDTIISFDQHHDCWGTQLRNRKPRRETGRIINVTCDIWGRAWLEENPDRRLVWVYPDHLDFCAMDDMAGLHEQIIITPRRMFNISEYNECNGYVVKGIHVCRSGCWSPPWLDEAFIEFVKGSGLQTMLIQKGIWNPMKMRVV